MKTVIPIIFLLLNVSMVPVERKGLFKDKAPRGFTTVDDLNIIVANTETTLSQWKNFQYSSGDEGTLVPNPFNQCLDQMTSENDYAVYYRDTTITNRKGKPEKVKLSCSRLPVTGVSYEQALAYCDWLTEYYAGNPKLPDYQFRLPTKKELQTLIGRTMDPMRHYEKGYNEKGCTLFNHKHNSWCEYTEEAKQKFGYAVPMPVAFFFPGNDGLYDLMGNVAEMTNEPGVAVGGSCIHTAAECQANAINDYTEPVFWLGFRVVADKL
jgi:formylglycine-generating enzyme required for sulfatase activity